MWTTSGSGSPSLLGLRAAAEARFERRLRAAVTTPTAGTPDAVPRRLVDMVAADDGPSLAKYLQRQAI